MVYYLERIFNETKYYETFLKRLKGLMMKKCIDHNSCHVLKTNGVHTFFMRFSIHVIYLDHRGYVLYIQKSLPPNRVAPINLKAKYVIETTNELAHSIQVGDQVIFDKLYS